jgi:hypothetical protein
MEEDFRAPSGQRNQQHCLTLTTEIVKSYNVSHMTIK